VKAIAESSNLPLHAAHAAAATGLSILLLIHFFHFFIHQQTGF
jgi:hypothetical protein